MVTIGAVHIGVVSIFVMHDTQAMEGMEREYILLCIPTTKWCYNSDYTQHILAGGLEVHESSSIIVLPGLAHM